MNEAAKPSQFLRQPTGLLRCCVGIGTMFQCLIHQFLDLFANRESEVVSPGDLEPNDLVPNDASTIQIHPEHDVDPVPNDPSSLQIIGQVHDAERVPNDSSFMQPDPVHDAVPVPTDPSFVQVIGQVHDAERVPNDSSFGTKHDTLDSEKTPSCRSNELKKIKDKLISRVPLDLQVIPIVGMGGIGKTTLAKSIYEDVEISFHFHIRAWTTVSQDSNLRNVLLGLLRSMVSDTDQVCQLENEHLEKMLYQNLKGKKFVIVLDDMWNAKIWVDLKQIFPNDKNGSRIIMTSRMMKVADYVELSSPPHHLDPLSDEESWRLLHSQVFVGKACPYALVSIGKKIANHCQGLPLAIMVVAGYLSEIDMKPILWADVAKSLDSLISRNEKKILDILCLSYNHLSRGLKACFIYMGIFPKNSEIDVLKLIRLWTAVGFLPSEDEAEKCLKDLINRNLIMVREKKYGTARTCGIHDFLWELSLREARKEGPQKHVDMIQYLVELTSTYRYLGSFSNSNFSLQSISHFFSRLRVLEIQSKEFFAFPVIITSLHGLRYLELSTSEIPESVSGLYNLETLIIRPIWRSFLPLPKEIWSLQRLRHLQVENGIVFHDSNATLSYLQTLSTVCFTSCTRHVFSRIPNLKQLKVSDIDGDDDNQNLSNFLRSLVYFSRLENLNLHFSSQVRRQIPWENFIPSSVKHLTLNGSRLQWEQMNNLAKLPNIEVLKLKNHAFEGPIYEQTIEGFPRLKFLLLEKLHLSKWIAETSDQYPILQQLVLRHCYFLKEIPYCFGEIPTLEGIELSVCSELAHQSARIIQEEQLNIGNYDLQVRFSENHGDCATMKQKREAWSSLENNNQLTPMEEHRAKRRRGK